MKRTNLTSRSGKKFFHLITSRAFVWPTKPDAICIGTPFSSSPSPFTCECAAIRWVFTVLLTSSIFMAFALSFRRFFTFGICNHCLWRFLATWIGWFSYLSGGEFVLIILREILSTKQRLLSVLDFVLRLFLLFEGPRAVSKLAHVLVNIKTLQFLKFI